MKKIILALAVLAAVVCPVFAGESWIGVTTGPAFEISKEGDADAYTDFNWDVNVEGAYYFNEAETIGIGAKLGLGFNYATSLDIPANMENPASGTRLAPAITFQYRLGLTDALDLRMGAGLQYVHVFMNGFPKEFYGYKVELAQDNLEIVANADVVYSIGDFQVFGGIDLGVSVMCHLTTTAMGHSEGEFITDGFQMSVTPRIGVSYAF